MERDIYGFETDVIEAVGENSFSSFGSKCRPISQSSDDISLDLNDWPTVFADTPTEQESIAAGQDDLSPARGLLFALALSGSIWGILILGGWYFFA
jgi:hypothetical protein